MAVPTDPELQQLLDRFVCVRQIQMWRVDLERFQFDFALTWAVFFLNGDGKIYGRYGSRSQLREGSASEVSVAGFKQALTGALALHERYRADPGAVTAEVEGKQPRGVRWPRAEKIPALAAREKLARPFGEGHVGADGTCIHCHMIPHHELLSLRASQQPIDDRLLWPYPMPDAVGVHMDPTQRATVQRVAPKSPAAAAGLEPGDEILRLAGQAILSTADLQWVLHHAGDPAELTVEVARAGKAQQLELALPPEWRRVEDWRFTNLGVLAQAVGFNGRQMPATQAKKRGLDPDAMALVIERVQPKRLAGVDLRRGDVIVEIDGQRAAQNLGQLTSYVCRDKKPGSELKLVVRRGEREHAVTVVVH